MPSAATKSFEQAIKRNNKFCPHQYRESRDRTDEVGEDGKNLR